MIIIAILAIVITVKLGNILFRNTIGTMSAYFQRYFILFMVVLIVLSALCHEIGLV